MLQRLLFGPKTFSGVGFLLTVGLVLDVDIIDRPRFPGKLTRAVALVLDRSF